MHTYTNKPGVRGDEEVREKVNEHGMITVMPSQIFYINNMKAHIGVWVIEQGQSMVLNVGFSVETQQKFQVQNNCAHSKFSSRHFINTPPNNYNS